jgi:hypothetical protein
VPAPVCVRICEHRWLLIFAGCRVLYIDIDIHHGDGVQEAFYVSDRWVSRLPSDWTVMSDKLILGRRSVRWELYCTVRKTGDILFCLLTVAATPYLMWRRSRLSNEDCDGRCELDYIVCRWFVIAWCCTHTLYVTDQPINVESYQTGATYSIVKLANLLNSIICSLMREWVLCAGNWKCMICSIHFSRCVLPIGGHRRQSECPQCPISTLIDGVLWDQQRDVVVVFWASCVLTIFLG